MFAIWLSILSSGIAVAATLFADIHSRRKKGRAELGRHMGAELVAAAG